MASLGHPHALCEEGENTKATDMVDLIDVEVDGLLQRELVTPCTRLATTIMTRSSDVL